MTNYSKFRTINYENEKAYINSARDKNVTWEQIKLCKKKTVFERDEFLIRKKEEEYWNITPEEWEEYVDYIKGIKEEQKPVFICMPEKPIISVNNIKGSCWYKYKEKLSKPNSGFSDSSIAAIEYSSQRIISYLEPTTDINDPIRGMVVGNVQSGKTANMSAVIAMAADLGYNFFIVLSGTIDNLRQQTQERLIRDLDNGSNLHFKALNRLSSKTNYPDNLSNLNLVNSNDRYITVCLKNSTRLKDLLNWMNKDHFAKEQLRILVIDDEADQAGVNTKDVDTVEQTAISRLIKNIVFGRTAKDEVGSPYCGMNYIGYTATPYANFLNESGNDTLYPKNFICLLRTPFSYFGPQQIFGIEEINDGLNIINEITVDEEKVLLDTIKSDSDFPDSLKDALGWFIITVALARYYDLKTPVSMLIHTSQNVDKHYNIEKYIRRYFGNIEIESYLLFLEALYNQQKKMITVSDLQENITEYQNEIINDYPNFKELKNEILKIMSLGLTNIKFDEDVGRTYNEGLHLCIDNCKATSSSNEILMRIVYPEKNAKIREKCPAFIVIGGSTLSRGLTLEGLTTSYFIRSSKQADTLMQMGRRFGYRQKYELFQRIWLSNKTFEKFQKLSHLDYELRKELNLMEVRNLSPEKYGPRIEDFPYYKMLILTSRKKMQSSYIIQQSFYDKSGQITKFYKDNSIINENYNKTIEFLNSLGKVDTDRIKNLKNKEVNKRKSLIRFDVDYKKTIDFIFSLKLPNSKATFDNYDNFIEWYEKDYENDKLDNFTIVIANSTPNESKAVQLLSGEKIYLENRSRYEKDGLNKVDYNTIIDLKTITLPGDTYLDVNCSLLNDDEITQMFPIKYRNSSNDKIKHSEMRLKYASKKAPLLILYLIDKDGGKDKKGLDKNGISYTRKSLKDLNLSNHLVGYYVYIPFGDDTKPNNYVSIKLKYDEEEFAYED